MTVRVASSQVTPADLHTRTGAETQTVTTTVTSTAKSRGHPDARPPRSSRGSVSTGLQMSLNREVGQLIIATYAGTAPPPSMLAAVRAGQAGAVILMGDNTAGGNSSVAAATRELQAAARAGGNPGLLIMTDQEGGEVKRLVGPPNGSAAQMGVERDAGEQGYLTGQLLKSVGINVDLAPVADVVRVNGFIAQEQRSFGDDPNAVGQSACAFASGLEKAGVAFTLKHFPGLGDAIQSTDSVPVNISESNLELSEDELPYARCGSEPLALVMVSSASYEQLTGSTPAVLSPTIYQKLMPAIGITALPISDSFESGAIEDLPSPALHAITAGLDMVMYPGTEAASAYAYQSLLTDAEQRALSRSRVQAAVNMIMVLKRRLGLT